MPNVTEKNKPYRITVDYLYKKHGNISFHAFFFDFNLSPHLLSLKNDRFL